MASLDLASLDSAAATGYDALHLTESEARAVLAIDLAKQLFLSHEEIPDADADNAGYIASITRRTQSILARLPPPEKTTAKSHLLHIISACHSLFLQSNVTGPVPAAPFHPEGLLLSASTSASPSDLQATRSRIIRELSVDGVAAYALIPYVELLAAAVGIARCEELFEDHEVCAVTARMRTRFLHQKMLNEATGTLQDEMFADLSLLASKLLREGSSASSEDKAKLLLESAAMHIYHGFDAQARSDLERAARETGFEYAITGRLGRRTKFQTRDISQLVVLAKSAAAAAPVDEKEESGAPKEVNLDDDTLLERISFTNPDDISRTDDPEETAITSSEKSMTVSPPSTLPASLSSLDPSSQPLLSPLDSIILLSLASAITNTSPQHGLTREETLPYAVRVIEGGSPNWQVYSQALLVRSKIEGYRSRTVERGLLQLQALVDQVVADTAANDTVVDVAVGEDKEKKVLTTNDTAAATSFLPRADKDDSAPAEDRLRYIWFLDFKTRWDLEAELASRWVSVGGLRTALEIYERLQMWAEVALCYAATEQEDKARIVVRRQLFNRTNKDKNEDNDSFEGEELPSDQLPPDAPRLFCILGDIENCLHHYERSWAVSNHRFARAQRSIARWHLAQRPPNYEAAEAAYAASLKINRLNHQAWFALGCVQLELAKFADAVESFTRTVQLEEEDAEAWSNLAAALMNMPEPTALSAEEVQAAKERARAKVAADEDETNADVEVEKSKPDRYKHKREALAALRRAAKFKREESRIWENLLTVAASIPPPETPFEDVILAMERIIAIRGPKQGEKCIDITILTTLITVLTQTEYDAVNSNRPGSLSRRILRLLDESVLPLITHSSALWLLVSRVEAWRERPGKALDAQEKSWRAIVTMYTPAAFQSGDEKAWNKIVDATVRVVREGYAGLGMKVRESSADEQGEESELVAKDWRFKSRSAVRSVLGKGKEYFEGTEGWGKLKELQSEVAGGNH